MEAKAALNLSFLPEGGEWILGLNNRLAFHATDANGMPVEVQGYIADNTGTRVTTFKTEHNGMGTVELTPAPGNHIRHLYALAAQPNANTHCLW